jgi:hypothetical protein
MSRSFARMLAGGEYPQFGTHLCAWLAGYAPESLPSPVISLITPLRPAVGGRDESQIEQVELAPEVAPQLAHTGRQVQATLMGRRLVNL